MKAPEPILVFHVFLLTLLRRLRHRLVQRFNAILQSGNLLRERGDGLLRGGDGALLVRDGTLQSLFLVVSGVELLRTVLLLVVVVPLLSLENANHVIHHLDDLLETALVQRFLAREREHQQIQGCVLALGGGRASLDEHIHGAAALLRSPRSQLHEARARRRKRLFEEIQRIVVIKNLDRVGKRDELLGPGLGALLPLRCLRGAALLQSLQELLVRQERRLGVRQVLFHLHDADTQLADLRGLRLDGCPEGLDLLTLGTHHLLVGLDRRLLFGSGFSEALLHGVLHLLQDTRDLAAGRRIAIDGLLSAGKEREDLLPVHVDHVLLALHHAAEHLRGIGLQEATSHAFLQCGDRLLQGANVGVRFRLLCCEGRGLLLANRRRLVH
mmetsp:Transcript_74283/g.215253  ORF Transcript_74283/g.215253 Transcript_74283/m.215253 type:complete len:384 (+) Transcript_74283:3265-4416(+)